MHTVKFQSRKLWISKPFNGFASHPWDCCHIIGFTITENSIFRKKHTSKFLKRVHKRTQKVSRVFLFIVLLKSECFSVVYGIFIFQHVKKNPIHLSLFSYWCDSQSFIKLINTMNESLQKWARAFIVVFLA